MCQKVISHNFYLGGHTDTTSRLEPCAPGYICAHPHVVTVQSTLPYPKPTGGRVSPLLPQLPRHSATFYGTPSAPMGMSAIYPGLATSALPRSPPTPPGSRGADEGRRSRIYFDSNGNRIVEVRNERSPRRHRERLSRLPAAPEPPAPRPAGVTTTMPIPIRRSATAPWGIDTPPHEQRGRRPIIVEERAPRSPRRETPSAPVEITEHATSGRRRSRRRDEGMLHPAHAHYRRGSGSPVGYGSAEDEADRHERRRRRREAKAAAAGLAASVPTMGNTDVFGTSPTYSSSYGSSHTASPVVDTSPAVAAVKKELRWEDEQRARQNDKIRGRPKMDRSATTTGAVQGEVRGILKNSPSASAGVSPVLGPTTTPPRASPRGSRDRARDDTDMEGLYRSVEGLGISGSDRRETSAERRSRAAEEQDAAAMMERLRNRFGPPPRRFTAGSGGRKRTEVWYPDGGRRYERYP